MDALQHIFTKETPKSPAIGTYTNTFILVTGKITNQKIYIQSGAYIERKQREIIPSNDFHLFKTKPDEKILTLVKQIADEGVCLKVNIFVGELTELLLAELYYTTFKYYRAEFNYAKRLLTFGDKSSTFISFTPYGEKYIVQVCIQYPITKEKHTFEIPSYTNEHKLIENLFKNLKLTPPPNPNISNEIDVLLKKYFPLKPYT